MDVYGNKHVEILHEKVAKILVEFGKCAESWFHP